MLVYMTQKKYATKNLKQIIYVSEKGLGCIEVPNSVISLESRITGRPLKILYKTRFRYSILSLANFIAVNSSLLVSTDTAKTFGLSPDRG